MAVIDLARSHVERRLEDLRSVERVLPDADGGYCYGSGTVACFIGLDAAGHVVVRRGSLRRGRGGEDGQAPGGAERGRRPLPYGARETFECAPRVSPRPSSDRDEGTASLDQGGSGSSWAPAHPIAPRGVRERGRCSDDL